MPASRFHQFIKQHVQTATRIQEELNRFKSVDWLWLAAPINQHENYRVDDMMPHCLLWANKVLSVRRALRGTVEESRLRRVMQNPEQLAESPDRTDFVLAISLLFHKDGNTEQELARLLVEMSDACFDPQTNRPFANCETLWAKLRSGFSALRLHWHRAILELQPELVASEIQTPESARLDGPPAAEENKTTASPVDGPTYAEALMIQGLENDGPFGDGTKPTVKALVEKLKQAGFQVTRQQLYEKPEYERTRKLGRRLGMFKKSPKPRNRNEAIRRGSKDKNTGRVDTADHREPAPDARLK